MIDMRLKAPDPAESKTSHFLNDNVWKSKTNKLASEIELKLHFLMPLIISNSINDIWCVINYAKKQNKSGGQSENIIDNDLHSLVSNVRHCALITNQDEL